MLPTRASTCFLHVRARYLFVRARLLFKNVRPGRLKGSPVANRFAEVAPVAAPRAPLTPPVNQGQFDLQVINT